MHARRAATAVLLTIAAATAGCSADSGDDTKPAADASTQAVTSTAPTPSATPSGPMVIGDTYSSTREDQGVTYKTTSTVLAYEHDVKVSIAADEENGTDGYVWSALEIKVCALSDGIGVSRFPWILAYADGSRVEPSGTTYGDFPKPEYPIEADVKNGDCVRGKITYAVPGDQHPVKVIYAPEGLPEPVEWTMPKS